MGSAAESMASDVKEWITKTVDAAVHLKVAELKQHILAAYDNAKAIPLGEFGPSSYHFTLTTGPFKYLLANHKRRIDSSRLLSQETVRASHPH